MAAVTSTVGALTLTDVFARTVMPPPASITILCPAPDLSPATVMATVGAPVVSSNSSRLPARVLMTRRLLVLSGGAGSVVVPFQATGLEGDHHHGVDLGQHLEALVVVGVRGDQGGPGGDLLAVRSEPRQLDLHAALLLRVGQVGDEGRVHAEQPAAGPVREMPAAHGVPPRTASHPLTTSPSPARPGTGSGNRWPGRRSAAPTSCSSPDRRTACPPGPAGAACPRSALACRRSPRRRRRTPGRGGASRPRPRLGPGRRSSAPPGCARWRARRAH